jgi:hypothetical protein
MSKTILWKVVLQVLGLLLVLACFAPTSSAQCSIQVTPTNYLVFGAQRVNTSSPAQTVTFSANVYDGSCLTGQQVVLTNITVTGTNGTNASEFSATGNGATPCSTSSPLTVPQSCTVGVTFTPAAAGTRTAFLTFYYSVNGSPGNNSVNLVGGDEIVYVSTQSGGQILEVDGTDTFATAGMYPVMVVSGNPGEGGFSPEGVVIGPDGKLYITDPTNREIWRMNQDSTEAELVYNWAEFVSDLIPSNPQGPSFSSNSGGNLYFNSQSSGNNGNGSGVFEIPGVGSTPFGSLGTIQSTPPPVVIGNECNDSFCPDTGEGTAFDNLDDLLFVEAGNTDTLFSLSPPYTAASPTTVASFSDPIGVALNKATGQVFVFDFGENTIYSISSGVATPYYTFTGSTSGEECVTGTDSPTFGQFDNSGHLFVVTTTDLSNGCGRVWRIDPGDTPTATLLLDVNTAYLASTYGINTYKAIGLAMQNSGTQAPAQSPAGSVSPTGGSFLVGWPVGCNPTSVVGSNAGTCSYTYGLNYPAGMFQSGDIVNITPTETCQNCWLNRITGNGFAPSHLAEVLGYGGDGFIFSASCMTSSNVPCTFPPNNYYTTTSAWQSPDASATWCTFGVGQNNPQILKADPIGSNNWIGTLISCSDGGPKHIGGSGPTLSDWANVKGATGAAPTITFTTPANGAMYTQGQVVNSNYNCGPTGAPPDIAAACFGGPDLVNGTTTVQNGSPIDTSTLGVHSFEIAADVNSGPGADIPTVTYTVVAGAQVSATPANVYLGTFHVPGLGLQFVTVKNTGAVPLSISSVKVTSVSGKDSDDFFAFSLCPKTLSAGKSCFILVTFFADEVPANNPQMANLVITATGGSVVVPLSATVVKH